MILLKITIIFIKQGRINGFRSISLSIDHKSACWYYSTPIDKQLLRSLKTQSIANFVVSWHSLLKSYTTFDASNIICL